MSDTPQTGLHVVVDERLSIPNIRYGAFIYVTHVDMDNQVVEVDARNTYGKFVYRNFNEYFACLKPFSEIRPVKND